MMRVSVRFYAELNDLIPPAQRGREFEHNLDGPRAVGEILDQLGVPQGAVDLVLVNGRSAGLSYVVRDGDRLSVYPVFESLDIAPVARVRAEPLRTVRFLVDRDLAALGSALRDVGFDVAVAADDDDAAAAIAARERRVLLTRDQERIERTGVARAYRVTSDDVKAQRSEVLRRFDLASA